MPSPAQDNPTPAEPTARRGRPGKPKRSGPKPARPKADKATAALRVEDLLRVRLAGAALWEMCAYVRAEEKNPASVPWFVTDDRPAVSESQIRRYVQRTDVLIAAALERDRRKLLNLHLAQRRSLLARCLAQNDLSNARGILKDEAELLGLYPEKKTTVQGKVGGAPVVLNIVEEVIGPTASGETAAAGLPEIAEEIVTPTPTPTERPAA